ncbi:Tryptophan--tRNA ligase, mitochondrial [Lamellibrachia satsuma]|nr:Tryptophan--tRNA ligase, mitochondrial [Lamellibrachia satsuma]
MVPSVSRARYFVRCWHISQRTLSVNITHRCFSNRTTHPEDNTGHQFKKRIFSGIQPTGVPHLGNYFGAIKPWVELQEEDGTHVVLCVVDLHALTLPQDPTKLRENIRDMAASLLACGIDPKKSILFQQSSVSQHAELGWILGCLTTLPRLEHLPQWKQKSETMKEVPLGLFTYPVLQAADILLYKATHIPVGDDQVKHVELCRHLANVFNKKYGFFFPKPKVITGDFKRMKSLRNPAKKMSKSDTDVNSRIELTDSDDAIRQKLKKAVSDFTSHISYEPESRPGVSNLVNIHAAFSNLLPEEIVEDCLMLDTLTYKERVAEVVIEKLTPIRDEIVRLRNDTTYLDDIMRSGADQATAIAVDTYDKVKHLVGFT